ncbi:hypothetical protein SRHO_G00143740 [Serrasalmus rhombeus]
MLSSRETDFHSGDGGDEDDLRMLKKSSASAPTLKHPSVPDWHLAAPPSGNGPACQPRGMCRSAMAPAICHAARPWWSLACWTWTILYTCKLMLLEKKEDIRQRCSVPGPFGFAK